MLLSDARGRKVVSKSSAETVGKITDYVIDPTARTVAALVLKKTSGEGDTLPWDNILSVGDDAVIVADDDAIVTASGRVAELGDKRFAAHGKRVLDSGGVEHGELKDIDFDPATGTITALVVKDGTIDGITLVAVGSYAVIVRA